MSGRSRGRARVRIDSSQPTPVAQTKPASEKAPVPTPTPAPVTVPTRGVAPESGRGRGISTPTPATTSTTSQEKPSSSSEESPPQQVSPPHSQSSGSIVATQSLGRAALRGAPHQPCVTVRTELLPPLERLQLQEQGDISGKPAETKKEVRIESVLYTRPESCKDKKGVSGTPINILCNYFEVTSKPNWVLYQYHVDFAPLIDSRSLRIGLMKDHDKMFPLNKAFDGSTIYSLTKLHDEVTEVASTRQSDQQIIRIKIKRVGEIVSTSPQFVHLFNLIFRRCLKLYGMKEIDRCYFDMEKKIHIPMYNLELINGLSTSIANYENKLLLCAELTHKLLHKSTIHDLMKTIYDTSRSDNDFKEKCTSQLVGRTVMTVYNSKTYKIDDIDWDTSPKNEFSTKRGNVSFLDYYKNNYPDCKIMDLNQPLLVSLPSGKDKRRAEQIGQVAKPALLIPELCVVTGIDEKMRTDFRFKKELEKFSKVGPTDRCDRLSRFVHNFKNNTDVKAELSKWQIDLSTQPCQLEGRVLQPESLKFGNDLIKRLNERADWGNDMKGVRLFQPVNLNKWIIICPNNRKNSGALFVNNYMEVIRSMGIRASNPKEVIVGNDTPEQLVSALKQNIDEDTEMVVVIVNSKRKDRYDAIKRICCIEKPVPSQVCTSMIIDDDKKRRSVITKVAIQMNCKLGGEIWQTHIPLTNAMICGIDTYHDSAKKHGSVCAFIATTNKTYTKYFSRATLQETHQELSSNLSITVKSACEHYKLNNGQYPEKLVIYRDGISDGQLSMVKDHEIPQIEKAFSMIDANYKPSLTVIIVKKRGSTRFFANTRGALSNPPCGSVIDTVVSRAEWFDFYLISQCVTQGTVNPTHYNVIHDTLGIKAEHYQKLSFKLTHMYYNWPGTIRVPATCQYAHKLAFLVGQSLHKEHHGSLCDKLFYL